MKPTKATSTPPHPCREARLASLLLVAAALATGLRMASPSAQAQLFNVDAGTSSSPVYTGAAVLGGSGDLWNGYSNGSWVGSPTFVSIMDSTGSSASGVQFAVWNNSGSSHWPSGTTANPGDLMADYIEAPGWGASDGWPIKVQFNNLPISTSFRLIVYSAGDTAGQGATITLSDPSGNMVGSTTAASRDILAGAGVAFCDFIGTTTDNGSVYFEIKTTTDNWHALNGVQLQIVPEPSALALGLAGFGLVGLLRRRA